MFHLPLSGLIHAVVLVTSRCRPQNAQTALACSAEARRHSTDVHGSLGGQESDVGLQMTFLTIEVCWLHLHSRGEREIVESPNKDTFIYKNGVP